VCECITLTLFIVWYNSATSASYTTKANRYELYQSSSYALQVLKTAAVNIYVLLY